MYSPLNRIHFALGVALPLAYLGPWSYVVPDKAGDLETLNGARVVCVAHCQGGQALNGDEEVAMQFLDYLGHSSLDSSARMPWEGLTDYLSTAKARLLETNGQILESCR
jgi:hypothetical protein